MTFGAKAYEIKKWWGLGREREVRRQINRLLINRYMRLVIEEIFLGIRLSDSFSSSQLETSVSNY